MPPYFGPKRINFETLISGVLDSVGDRTTVQRRREYFNKHLSERELGAIDFERFLDLVNSAETSCGLLSGKRNLEILRKLPLEDILRNGLF